MTFLLILITALAVLFLSGFVFLGVRTLNALDRGVNKFFGPI